MEVERMQGKTLSLPISISLFLMLMLMLLLLQWREISRGLGFVEVDHEPLARVKSIETTMETETIMMLLKLLKLMQTIE